MHLVIRQCFSCVFIFSLIIWGNHCILNDAFLPVKEDTNQHSPCHGKSKDTGHRQKCEKSSCCQPLIKSDQSTHVSFEISKINNLFNIYRSIEVLELVPSYLFKTIKLTTGPPSLLSTFILSLSFAPQAPPIQILL